MALGTILTVPENGWTRYDDRSELLKYLGLWEQSPLSGYYLETLSYTNELGASVTFKFYGTKLRLIGRVGTNGGDLSILVDGVSFPITNYSTISSQLQSVFFEKTDLSQSIHTVTLTKSGVANIWLDAIDVLGELKSNSNMIIKNPTTNQHYSLADKTLILLPTNSVENIINYGIEAGKEIKLDGAFDKINYPVEGTLVKTMVKPLSIKFE